MINEKLKKDLLFGMHTSIENNSVGFNVGRGGELLYKAIISRELSVQIDIEPHVQMLISVLNPKTYKKSYASSFYQDGAELARIMMLLESQGKLQYDYSDFYNYIDNILSKRMEYCISINNFEPTEGALGIGYYFLEREITTGISYKPLDRLIEVIRLKKKSDNSTGYYWLNSLFGEERAYLGWHGVSSYINFLLEVSKTNRRSYLIDELINGGCAFLENNRFEDISYISSFPLWKGRNLRTTNLCVLYGDLSVSTSLVNAGLYLKEDRYYKLGISTSLQTINRRSEDVTAIKEASILYGASGTAIQYENLYRKTLINEYKVASNYWIDYSTQETYILDNEINLKRYFFENNSLKKSIGFGSLGAALSILLCHSQRTDVNKYLYI